MSWVHFSSYWGVTAVTGTIFNSYLIVLLLSATCLGISWIFILEESTWPSLTMRMRSLRVKPFISVDSGPTISFIQVNPLHFLKPFGLCHLRQIWGLFFNLRTYVSLSNHTFWHILSIYFNTSWVFECEIFMCSMCVKFKWYSSWSESVASAKQQGGNMKMFQILLGVARNSFFHLSAFVHV